MSPRLLSLFAPTGDQYDAPEALKTLQWDMSLTDRALDSLRDINDSQWESLGEVVVGHARVTIKSCSDACSTFGTNLHKWTKRSTDGKLSWRDRGNIGFFRQSQIKSMSQQLQNCHIMSMASTATLHSSLQNNEASDRLEKTLSEGLDQVTNSIAALNIRAVETQGAASAPPQQADQPQEITVEAVADVLAHIREERKALEASRQFYEDLLERTREAAAESQAAWPWQKHTCQVPVNGSNNRGLQMGVNEGTMNNLQFG
ncbi:uncharacterized protein B0H64DRAFT_428551 [Chaetomium fimeti]|uniref:Azaphilone pigments biosynthesis cluster protein L N-terminal domain-containing protein n=1 Tax=Chaetomium fimeti TaxID=1854472 RepID=A0AAE0HPS8_9PEZI|nr:hypothetical protein B0H64DRAFT_428551 [Chaetomium fimeti]